MVLLIFSQGERDELIGLFNSLEQGREFLQKIPGYQLIQDDVEGILYSYEVLDPSALSDYAEIHYKGNRLPMTRFSFASHEAVDIYWQELPYLDKADQGLLQGRTRVDAYLVDNREVKKYIQRREEVYGRLAAKLKEWGYKAGRSYDGSEDGEAMTYQKNGEKEDHILAHMDPEFVELLELQDSELEIWIKDRLR